MDLKKIETELMEWHGRKYGRTFIDVPSTMRKFGEEIGEFIEAVMNEDPEHIAEEAADVMFLMMHISRHFGGAGSLDLAATSKITVINDRLAATTANRSG